MLPWGNRVRSWFFTASRKPVFSINKKQFSVKIFEKKVEKPQIAVVVSKKIEKTAVKRNFLKRKTFNLFEKYIKNLPNAVYIVYLKNNNIDDLLKELEEVIKNNLLDK